MPKYIPKTILAFKKTSLIRIAIITLFSLLLPLYSFSSTITLKGNTQATLYGFVKDMFSWNKQVKSSPDYTNMPTPEKIKKNTPLHEKTYDKLNTTADSFWSRIGLRFKNEQARISGVLEGDFANYEGSERLRLAYVKHKFNHFYIIVGQDWVLEVMHESIDHTAKVVAGFNRKMKRVPQVQIGSNIDFNSASVNAAVAFEWAAKKAVGKEVDRIAVPQIATRFTLHFRTGFGSPSMIYTWGSIIPVYITTGNLVDDSENAYAFGVGTKIPIYSLTLGMNYNYTYGALGYLGLTNYSPKSWYDKNGAQPTKAQVFNVNIIKKITKSFAIAGEYDWVQLKNNDVFTNSDKPKVETWIGQLKLKTTKYTSLTFEYRHISAKDFNAIPNNGVKDDYFSGSQAYVVYKYVF